MNSLNPADASCNRQTKSDHPLSVVEQNDASAALAGLGDGPRRMSLSRIDFFDKGVAFDPDRPCLVSGEDVRTYGETQRSSYRYWAGLGRAI